MRAVLPADTPTRSTPRVGERPAPRPGPGEVLLRVRACALNRADLLQMKGQYPPPPGESEVPGLECAGEVAELGPEVSGWLVGDRAMALLAGGGQAELAAVPVGQLMPIPERLDFTAAAALPEAALTSWTNLVVEGRLEAGQSVLITAAASGIGTFAVQLASELGARVIVAGRSLERLETLRDLGADVCLELGANLPEEVRRATGGGVDLIVDLVGGSGLGERLGALADGGRLVLVGLLGGARSEILLADLLRRRLRLIGSVLRARSREEKASLVGGFWTFARDRLADGRLRPVVDRVYPFAEIAEAYAQMERGGVLGKLVVTLD